MAKLSRPFTPARPLAVILALGLLGGGCTLLELPPELPTEEPAAEREPTVDELSRERQAQAAADLLVYYRRTADLDEAALRASASALAPNLDASQCTTARLRLAILATRLPPGDRPGPSETLLGPCLAPPFAQNTTEGGLAQILAALLDSQARAADRAATVQTLEERRDALLRETRELNKQLEGLRAIERSIQERDRTTTPEGTDE